MGWHTITIYTCPAHTPTITGCVLHVHTLNKHTHVQSNSLQLDPLRGFGYTAAFMDQSIPCMHMYMYTGMHVRIRVHVLYMYMYVGSQFTSGITL